MDLSPEDLLRLNVLLANAPQAIRIHESTMTVYGLSEQGEASITLHPTCRDDQYLRCVRELLSGQVLGSPGGYPVYLKRWTRMGQTRSESLEQLLLLGEPEAVAAVVHAPGLSAELARRAWWADGSAESARQMLKRSTVAQGALGKVLARHLLEHLAFEDDPQTMIETVRQILQPGLIEDEERLAIWNQGRRRNAYRVGFLLATPDRLPEPEASRRDRDEYVSRLEPLVSAEDPLALQLLRVFSEQGQTFIATAAQVLEKPFNQDVVNTLLDAIADYFASVRPAAREDALIEEIVADAERLCRERPAAGLSHGGNISALLEAAPALRPEVRAMLILSRLGYPVVRPVFSRTTAIGTLMRRKLAPVTDHIFEQFRVLLGSSS
jgi:hypothetical protein